MQLGELLALGQASSDELHSWLRSQDHDLLARLQQEAGVRGESLAQFVRIAISDFVAEADEEAWADLVSALRDANDPGAACISKATAFRMRMERAA